MVVSISQLQVQAYEGALKVVGASAYRDISAARESGKHLTKESTTVQNAISILNQSSEIAKIAGNHPNRR